MKKTEQEKKSRRNFIKKSGMIGMLPFVAPAFSNELNETETPSFTPLTSNFESDNDNTNEKSVIGLYGQWAASLLKDPPALSYRNDRFKDLDQWKKEVFPKAKELVATPTRDKTPPKVTIKKTYEYDGLHIEELEWQLPYGRKTQAILLKPLHVKKPLPGILALHDHGGIKYFGKRKITKTSDNQHPLMAKHQEADYSGNAWANDIAKKGYVVLVHDAFAFASRRVMIKDMSEITWGHWKTVGLSDDNPEDIENIKTYNAWAAEQAHIMARSLFSAGTTWPGVTLHEDQIALDILCDRSDVDENSIGCGGLSGGGLRTNFLGGFDERIKCAVSVGFTTTWADFVVNKSYTHTWMAYAPILPQYLDFPEIFGLRVPLPTMVLSNNEDGLYTLSEMKKADKILKDVFKKAGAEDKYIGKFYPGIHKFDADMQKDAYDWFDQWLK